MSEVAIRTAAATPVWEYLSPAAVWRDLWSRRDLIRQFSSRELLERHKGAYLGVAWNVLSPLLTLAVYTFVFGVVLRARWETPATATGGMAHPSLDAHPLAEFTLALFCGHTFFHVFAEMVNRAPQLVASRPNLVKKVVFPVQVLPVVVLVSAVVYLLICVGLLLVGVLGLTGRVPWTAVFVPVVLLPLGLISLGFAWVLAAVGVFVKDLRQIVAVVVSVLMFMTPIFYPIERVPEGVRWAIAMNPMTVIVENSRRVLLWEQMPQWGRLGALTVAGLVCAQIGYAFFMKSKRGMADVV